MFRLTILALIGASAAALAGCASGGGLLQSSSAERVSAVSADVVDVDEPELDRRDRGRRVRRPAKKRMARAAPTPPAAMANPPIAVTGAVTPASEPARQEDAPDLSSLRELPGEAIYRRAADTGRRAVRTICRGC